MKKPYLEHKFSVKNKTEKEEKPKKKSKKIKVESYQHNETEQNFNQIANRKTENHITNNNIIINNKTNDILDIGGVYINNQRQRSNNNIVIINQPMNDDDHDYEDMRISYPTLHSVIGDDTCNSFYCKEAERNLFVGQDLIKLSEEKKHESGFKPKEGIHNMNIVDMTQNEKNTKMNLEDLLNDVSLLSVDVNNSRQSMQMVKRTEDPFAGLY